MSAPVRPSSYQLAELCGRAPYLGTKYRESTERTRFGSAADEQASRALKNAPDYVLVLNEDEAAIPEALSILEWVARTFPPSQWQYFVQRKVQLLDPFTGELLTQGTPDFLALNRVRRFLCVVDWKTMGQWWAGHLAPPDENLQQLIYLVAAGMELSAELGCEIASGQITLACYDDRGVNPKTSREIQQKEWWDVIDRAKAVPQVDVDGPEPEATKGKHCGSCYNRHHCSAHILPQAADLAPALVPFSQPGELSHEDVVRALEWLEEAEARLKRGKELVEIVEGNINAYSVTHGPIVVGDRQYGPIETKGKRSAPKVDELEAAGLGHLIKPAKPGIKYGWMDAGRPVPTVVLPEPGSEKPKREKAEKKTPAARLKAKAPAEAPSAKEGTPS